jgi:putative transposase
LNALLLSDEDGFRGALQTVVQQVLEAEMTEAVGAEKGSGRPSG